MTTGSYEHEGLGAFITSVAARSPAPGGGSVAAIAAALAASLVGKAGCFSSDQIEDASELVEEATALARQALTLADADASAFGKVREAYRLPRDEDPARRCQEIRAALEKATEVPLEVARVATRVAILGARLAQRGNPNLKGDATVAVILAKAATRGAMTLAEENIRVGKLDKRLVDLADAGQADHTSGLA